MIIRNLYQRRPDVLCCIVIAAINFTALPITDNRRQAGLRAVGCQIEIAQIGQIGLCGTDTIVNIQYRIL